MSNELILDPIDVLREELIPYRHGFSIDEVDEITLLSIEEARRLPQDILKANNWWWLRSSGTGQNRAAYVFNDGGVNDYGLGVNIRGGVRPAFRINNLKLWFGEKVCIGKNLCTVIGEGLILSDKIIYKYRFDTNSNNWDTSKLKAFITESEEFKNYIVKGV